MIIILMILIAIGATLTIINFNEGDPANGTFWSISTVISIIALIIAANEPKPIDTYRNKVTLEITFRNGVAIDSTVIYKSKK